MAAIIYANRFNRQYGLRLPVDYWCPSADDVYVVVGTGGNRNRLLPSPAKLKESAAVVEVLPQPR